MLLVVQLTCMCFLDKQKNSFQMVFNEQSDDDTLVRETDEEVFRTRNAIWPDLTPNKIVFQIQISKFKSLTRKKSADPFAYTMTFLKARQTPYPTFRFRKRMNRSNKNILLISHTFMFTEKIRIFSHEKSIMCYRYVPITQVIQ